MSLVPAGVEWDDPAGYAVIARHGRSGLAWEFLRRDPDYHSAFAALGAAGQETLSSAFTARWGLHFRA